jgi:hypothetical protein
VEEPKNTAPKQKLTGLKNPRPSSRVFQNQPTITGRLLIQSFNGKPQASLPNFAYACDSPLNENTKFATETLVHQ